ncbi:MAG: hypothetical protein A2W90_09725 [Bacteroidetes bacterium GWF2_42_66]|nr:MAG: hypothetical protein A2W92_05275 [Bacteroidetes bacterium GWA2_42_15]OFX97556.1 MAG: hypothetical protein A2W89_01680 [Bacteroidetes bacterium GWE2_42_39]OFY43749.1 MAG: hypothetical protein A2W90_09725 [Bacteroidetes bacterium GWF2_42_66]HBL76275.1 hypothetical protein [Prolixibacteraceae bacterium]HCU60513.1 hypothetical protein [Prolixibacteraceae bacterium]
MARFIPTLGLAQQKSRSLNKEGFVRKVQSTGKRSLAFFDRLSWKVPGKKELRFRKAGVKAGKAERPGTFYKPSAHIVRHATGRFVRKALRPRRGPSGNRTDSRKAER